MRRRIYLWGDETEFYIASDDEYFDATYDVNPDCQLYIEFNHGSAFRADLADGLWMIWPSSLVLYGKIECTQVYDLDKERGDTFVLESKESAVTVMEAWDGKHRVVEPR
jgi:hypothetical protein